MRCDSSVISTHRRSTGGFSSLMQVTNKMSRTGRPCSGPSNTSGLVARSLTSTDTTTGPQWWYVIQGNQANSFVARRE